MSAVRNNHEAEKAQVCSCGNRFDGDNLCMPSACQWEGIEPEPRAEADHTPELIEWTKGKWSEEGRAGGFILFSICWGTTRQDNMWSLSTTLPVRARSAIGQHYPTPTHAKVAAERLLRAFIERVSTPPAGGTS